MTEVSGDGGGVSEAANWTLELYAEDNSYNVRPAVIEAVWGSFKDGRSSSRRRAVRPSLDANEFMNLLHGSDPVKVELNRLENEVRGERRELDLVVL